MVLYGVHTLYNIRNCQDAALASLRSANITRAGEQSSPGAERRWKKKKRKAENEKQKAKIEIKKQKTENKIRKRKLKIETKNEKRKPKNARSVRKPSPTSLARSVSKISPPKPYLLASQRPPPPACRKPKLPKAQAAGWLWKRSKSEGIVDL